MVNSWCTVRETLSYFGERFRETRGPIRPELWREKHYVSLNQVTICCHKDFKFVSVVIYKYSSLKNEVQTLRRRRLLSMNEGTEQDKQCTYNVTLRRVRATIVVVEKQWVLHILSVCISSLSYPARNAHAPYCHLWPAPLYKVFPHYLINGTIFEKKNTEYKMCVLIFSTTFVWNISHSKKNLARYDKKCILVFM